MSADATKEERDAWSMTPDEWHARNPAHTDGRDPHIGPTREELAHEVERLRGLMEQQDRRIIRLTAELNMHARPKGFVNAKKRRRMEARAVKHAIVEVLR